MTTETLFSLGDKLAQLVVATLSLPADDRRLGIQLAMDLDASVSATRSIAFPAPTLAHYEAQAQSVVYALSEWLDPMATVALYEASHEVLRVVVFAHVAEGVINQPEADALIRASWLSRLRGRATIVN